LVSLFSNDMKQMQQRKASVVERWSLMRTNLQSLGGIYKLHNINPFAVFLSPLMQLPIFWYVVS
jgi:membrane protein insertase Oxa1/YidC/SpoIIIJ